MIVEKLRHTYFFPKTPFCNPFKKKKHFINTLKTPKKQFINLRSPKKDPKTQNQIALDFSSSMSICFLGIIEVLNNYHQDFFIKWNP